MEIKYQGVPNVGENWKSKIVREGTNDDNNINNELETYNPVYRNEN